RDNRRWTGQSKGRGSHAETRAGLLPIRAMRPLAVRVQVSHVLVPAPDWLLPLARTGSRRLPLVRIRDWLRWLVPYRGLPVLAVSDASARTKQMRSFMPVSMQPECRR